MRTYPRPSICRYMRAPSSVIAQRECTNLSTVRVANPGSRSTRKTVSTARLATSRTRPRTSTGLLPKAVEGPITRTCKWLGFVAVAALALGSAPAQARLAISDAARTYVEARAAAMNGDHARAAQLLAALSETQPDQADIKRKALSEALGAGRIELALGLARSLPVAKLPTDARLL